MKTRIKKYVQVFSVALSLLCFSSSAFAWTPPGGWDSFRKALFSGLYQAKFSSLILPHRTAPSSPTNGEIWTTTAGIYGRINGTTVGPLASATGSFLPLAGGTMTGNITSTAVVNPFTTAAESWIGPSSTTGVYFKGGNVGIGTTSPPRLFTIAATTPIFEMIDNGAAAGNGRWVQAASGGTYYHQLMNDAESSGVAYLQVTRSGQTVTNIAFPVGKVGIGTAAPTSTAHINGSFALALAAKTASYTVTATDSILTSDATAGVVTFTLPTAVGITGRRYTIKRIDASVNATILDGAGSETIDGAATKTLATQWSAITVFSDGANWLIESTLGTVT